jgi:hypothetical protein
MGKSWLLVRFLVCYRWRLSIVLFRGPPVVFRHILGKDIFCKPSNLMLVVTGSATSGSASSMAAFGPIQTSSGLVLESFGPKSSVQASPF